jgi:hypothetical protein
MSIQLLSPESVTLVRRDGSRISNVVVQIGDRKILTRDDAVAIEDGDILERSRPDGAVDRFRVLDNGYRAKGLFDAHYSIRCEKVNDLPRRQAAVTNVYNLHGANARVNYHSHDQSVNVVNTSAPDLFRDLREAIAVSVEDEAERRDLLTCVHGLEREQSKPTFAQRF